MNDYPTTTRIMEYAEFLGRVKGCVISCRELKTLTNAECVAWIGEIIEEFESEKEDEN